MYRRIRILWPSGSTESWSRRNQIVLLVIACYVAAAVLGMGLALMQDGGRGVEAPITPRPTRTPGAGGRARTGTPPAHNTPGPLPVVTNPEPFATLPLVESSPVFATPAPAQTLAGGPTRVPFPTPPPATQAPFPTFVPPSTTPIFPTPPPGASGTSEPRTTPVTATPTPTPGPGTSPAPPPATVTPYPGILVLMSNYTVSSSGYFRVFGEVKNSSGGSVGQVTLDATLYDSAGLTVGTWAAYTYLLTLRDGEASPFLGQAQLDTQTQVSRVDVAVTEVFTPSGTVIDGISVTDSQFTHDAATGQLALKGTINYHGTITQVHELQIAAIVMDAANQHVVRLLEDYADETLLVPGQSSTFDLRDDEDTADVGSVRFYFFSYSQ